MWLNGGEEQKVPKKIESCGEPLITSGKPCQRNRKVFRFPAQASVIRADTINHVLPRLSCVPRVGTKLTVSRSLCWIFIAGRIFNID